MREFLECLLDLFSKLSLFCPNPQRQLFRLLSCLVPFFQDNSKWWSSSFLSKIDPSFEFSSILPPKRLFKEVPELERAFFVPVKSFLLALARECVLNPLFVSLSDQIHAVVNQSGTVIPRGWTTAGSIFPETTNVSVIDLSRRHINHHARSGHVEKSQLFDAKNRLFLQCEESLHDCMVTQINMIETEVSHSLELMLLSQKRFRFLHRYDMEMDASLQLEIDQVGLILLNHCSYVYTVVDTVR